MTETEKIDWRKNLFFIWLCQILSIAGFASAVPFIPIFIRDRWGITSEQELGLWMSAFYFFGMFSFCVSTPIWGWLSDRYGRKLMLLRACYIDALLFPCFILAPNPVWLIVIRFIVSMFTGTVSAAQTLIVSTTPREHHGFALGTLSSAIWSGNLVGLAVGGVIIHYFGFTAAFLICGGMYLLAGILAHLFVRDNFVRPTAAQRQKMPKLFSGLTFATALVFLLIVLTALARKLDEPYVAIMIEKIHGPDKTAFYTGWISAAAAFGGIFSGMFIGRLCDRYTPEKITLSVILTAAGTMFLQAFSGSLAAFGGWRFVHYLAAGGLEPAFLAILARIVPPQRQGAIFGLASGIRMTGILIGALLSGGVVYFAGVRNVYTAAGIAFLAIIPFFYFTLGVIGREKGESAKK